MTTSQILRRARILPALLAFAVATGTGSARAELIYVTLQNEVVTFDLSSGNGATIAATKTTVATGLSEAMGLVFGGDGNLYVATYGTGTGTGTVRQYTPGNLTGTVFASGFTDTRGITYSSASNTFFVANSGSPGSISQVSSGGTVSNYLTFGTNTSPYGLALDGAGALYSANNASHSISEIAGGVPSAFTTFPAGQGVRGVAVAANGDVYATGDFGLSVTDAAGTTTTILNNSLAFAFGLAFDATGKILVADYVNQTISAYNTAGTLQYSFSTGGGSSNRPRYLAFNTPGSGFNQVAAAPEPSLGLTLASLAAATVLLRRRRRLLRV